MAGPHMDATKEKAERTILEHVGAAGPHMDATREKAERTTQEHVVAGP